MSLLQSAPKARFSNWNMIKVATIRVWKFENPPRRQPSYFQPKHKEKPSFCCDYSHTLTSRESRRGSITLIMPPFTWTRCDLQLLHLILWKHITGSHLPARVPSLTPLCIVPFTRLHYEPLTLVLSLKLRQWGIESLTLCQINAICRLV